ncbi:MAG: hypothetical protein LDL41_11060 [Coleofasciculus sp. S288]|nr:hypothetical protein [Coleofasciculus sp. S288]
MVEVEQLRGIEPYWTALNKDGYKIQLVHLLLRNHNNYLLTRSPSCTGWSIPGIVPDKPYTLNNLADHLNKRISSLGAEEPIKIEWFDAPMSDKRWKSVRPRLLLVMPSAQLAPPPGYTWMWYDPYCRSAEHNFLGLELDRVFRKVRTNTKPVKQQWEERHNYGYVFGEQWVETTDEPRQGWLWVEGEK